MASRSGSFSHSFSGFFYRRFSELRGLGWWIAAGIIALSFVSYSPEDPSFNLAADYPASNILGYPGAVIADFLMQTLGLASILCIVSFMAWGWKLLSNHHNRGLWLRITCLCVSLPIFATLLSGIEAPLSWPVDTGLGGSIGVLLRSQAHNLLDSQTVSLICAGLLCVLVPLTFGLKLKDWKKLFMGMLYSWVFVASLVDRINPFSKRATFSGYKTPSINLKDKLPRMPQLRKTQEEVDEAPPFIADEKPKKPAKIFDRSEREDTSPSTSGPKINSKANSEIKEKQETFLLRRQTSGYELPDLELLKAAPKSTKKKNVAASALEQNAQLLESVLHDFGVKGQIVGIHPGPVVTLYELEPSPGTKSSRVIGLADDIARSMSAVSARISVIPGRNALGIELPNKKRETVVLRELLEDSSFHESDLKLPLALGKDIGGEPVVVDLARMPHLLVAGTTGSGKSVSVNTMIASLLYHLTPDECKFIMVDPKMLELSVYEGIPHLLSPVVTEPGKAVVALKWTVKEMENRYKMMASLGVRNIDGYNKRIKAAISKGEELKRTVQTGFDPETGKPIYEDQPLDMNPLPFIVVVVDEMADLMLVAGKDIETSIQRLAQMARAAGIHIIMATQRPSVDVITGVVKANFPTRISFQVTSRIDSRTILGEQGAEQLLGMGDMLYMAGGGRITRVHGPFVSDGEIDKLVSYLKTQGEPNYVEDVTLDPEEEDAFFEADPSDEDQMLYQKAVAIVKRDGKASTSYIQRQLKIGYNRAARLIEQMEREGLVSPASATGRREILMN